jgi:LemA protein
VLGVPRRRTDGSFIDRFGSFVFCGPSFWVLVDGDLQPPCGVAEPVQKRLFQIDVQLKRRYDLIPNLVETAKGYLKHERETLEAVIAARNQAFQASKQASANPADSGAMNSLITAESGLSGALSRLMVVTESYPELKANQNMLSVMEELTSTENKIAFARQAYNDSVQTYNTTRESFPANTVSGIFGFTPAALWEITESAHRENVKVSF